MSPIKGSNSRSSRSSSPSVTGSKAGRSTSTLFSAAELDRCRDSADSRPAFLLSVGRCGACPFTAPAATSLRRGRAPICAVLRLASMATRSRHDRGGRQVSDSGEPAHRGFQWRRHHPNHRRRHDCGGVKPKRDASTGESLPGSERGCNVSLRSRGWCDRERPSANIVSYRSSRSTAHKIRRPRSRWTRSLATSRRRADRSSSVARLPSVMTFPWRGRRS